MVDTTKQTNMFKHVRLSSIINHGLTEHATLFGRMHTTFPQTKYNHIVLMSDSD